MNLYKSTRGGKRIGAGRKSKHTTPMKQKTIRLPNEWVVALSKDFGTLQNAIETLTSKYLQKLYSKEVD